MEREPFSSERQETQQVRGPLPAAGRSATRSSRAPTSWPDTIARTRARRSSAAPSARSASCGATT
ncbi:similar to BTEB3 protein (predicted), isoform CRA_b [Rattus norvegicus]|uniref:Similar to BTEB3 protein (Predicted), isoform CRA_b n=1 Tax=Rattus norvegicus TaxID=10116 RepID=A6JBK2_RAT|nr:similar to BTEB3 protein (predicted), isoform CRA_b [Rattus norvegicus]